MKKILLLVFSSLLLLLVSSILLERCYSQKLFTPQLNLTLLALTCYFSFLIPSLILNILRKENKFPHAEMYKLSLYISFLFSIYLFFIIRSIESEILEIDLFKGAILTYLATFFIGLINYFSINIVLSRCSVSK